jgi:HAD superfamily hydrolase (TIGR01509 family)
LHGLKTLKTGGKKMKDFDAAIFDLDGTLIDSLGMWENLDREFLAKRGIRATPEYTAAVTAMSFLEAAEYTVRRFGFRETPEELAAEWNELVRDEYAHRIGLKPHAREYLEFLKRRGKTLGVATALPEGLYGPVLEHNGVAGFFRAFASVHEVGRGKGFPDVYLLAARRLGTPPERCVAFEDVEPALRGAKAAGMTAVGVYDAHSGDEAEMRAAADRYIRDFAELLPRGQA